jgi:hypothetical protein
MQVKLFRMRSLAHGKSGKAFAEFDLEFEGKRAFVIWDSITLGNYRLKARVEIDPRLLQADAGRGCDYFYRGELVLPHPEHN